jgi:predicted permease
MAHLLDDLRIGLRRLIQQPAFTLTAILTLALGLGANIAIFTLVNALMLRALPVERPDELYRLGDTNNCCVNSGLQGSYSLFSYRLFEHLRQATTPHFVELAAFQANTRPVAVRRAGAAVGESTTFQFVTANYFSMFGVRPAAGRLLQPDDDRPGAAPVAVLSHQAWTRHFAQDPSVVGGAFIVNGQPMTIVGVAAADFFGDTVRPNPAGIWLPIGQEPVHRGEASLIDRVNQDWLYAVGRLREGVRAAAVSATATGALQQWLGAQQFVGEEGRRDLPRQHINVVPAGGGVPIMQQQFGRTLTILFITSALVLLIASANLANLLLARADRGQAAIRAALGASTGRLLRQSLTEGVLLACVGGIVAIVIGMLATSALIAITFPAGTYVPVDASPSLSVLLFALGLAVVTGALFSAGPAWLMSRTPPLDALAGVGRSGQQRTFVPRRSLVIVQVALSFILLAGAGLLAATLGNLQNQTLGFEPEDRVVVRIDPPALAGQSARIEQLYTAVRERLQKISGVRDVTFALYSPMEGNNWSGRITVGSRLAANPDVRDSSSWNRVGPRFFETVGTRVLRGRALEDRDMRGGRPVAVVNDTFRRQFLAGVEPIGQTVGIGGAEHAGDYEIVGVVDDVKFSGPTQPTRPMIFLPAFQEVPYASPTEVNVQARSMLLQTLILNVAPGTSSIEPEVRRAIAEVDPALHVMRVLSMPEQVSGNFRLQRMTASLASVYGLLALALASVGLYGVTAYGVAQRTREIGVRMALGADRSRIMRTIVWGPVAQTTAGLAIGVPLAIFATRAIAAQLYGVTAGDPRVYAAAMAVLLASAVLAALIPARRAAAIEPTRALRGE